MKKVLSLLLAVCLIFSLVGCGSNNNDSTSQSTTIETNDTPKLPQTEQEKYEQAAKYIEQEKYDDAIKLLKEIPEYQDSKKHLYQAEFLYGCTLYNDKDFKNAHEHFESAYEILKNAFKDNQNLSNNSLAQKFKEDSKKYMYESAYYHAFDLLNNENYFAALDYFKKTLNNYNYKFGGQYGPDYAENIMYKLLDGRWTGEISADGNKLYVEMIFDSRRMNDGNLIGDLHIKWFDSPNSLIAFDYSKGRFAAHTDSSYLSDDVNNETISLEFDFNSRNKVDVVVNKVFIGANNPKYTGTLTKEEDGDCESYKIGFTPTTININQYDFSDDAVSTSQTTINNESYNNAGVNNSNNLPTKNNSSQSNAIDNTTTENIDHLCSCSAATCTKPKTCLICNATYGEPLEHQWLEATCTKPKQCKMCGKVSGEPIEHSWSEATCTEPKRCTVCKTTTGAALGHSAETSTSLICNRCYDAFSPNAENIIKNIPIEILGFYADSITAASISECSYSGGTKYSVVISIEYQMGNFNSNFGIYAYDDFDNVICRVSQISGWYTNGSGVETMYIPINSKVKKIVIK